MKRCALFFTIILCLILAAPVFSSPAKDNWTSVRSRNFLLVGNAGEKEMRKIATRLEQFRDVLARLLNARLDSSVPVNVVVFKSRDAYKPFGPPGTAGYFQAGQDVNYIALHSELEGENPFDIIFHEYTHFMVNNNVQNMPAWFNEGLAEYYSSFEITDGDKRVHIGKPITNHVLYLRQQKLIPLQTLFAVDHNSPLYNEANKRGIFYAQSWALVHYLMLGNKGRRFPQLTLFMNKLLENVPVEEAFQQAFQTDFKTLEKELKEYIGRDTYSMRVLEFGQKIEFDTTMQSAPLTEAEAQYYLGDLLLHSNQLERAEKHLQQALALDPNLAIAHAALGMLEVRRGRFAEAKQRLQRAVAGNSQNYLVHYYYAFVLSREALAADKLIYQIAPETAKTMRAELKKCIALAPNYAEAYHLLALVNVVTGEGLDESIELLKRAISLLPGEQQFRVMLAEVHMRKQDFKAARELLEPLARGDAEPELRARAQSMLSALTSFEAEMARFKSGGESIGLESAGERPALRNRSASAEAEEAQPEASTSGTEFRSSLESAMRKPREGETRVQGYLTRIDCTARGVVFTVKAGDRLLKLHTDDFERIEFTTYTTEVRGEIGCGPRNPANAVVITYRLAKNARAKIDGEIVALDFVPKDFVLSP
ncbi:MAG TPA: tetratricopeptide repeat protein [Pyrinomonadaceae bacterium]|nr:tetratricopeptide repeat protein [Pyrinomonadaceae bacterium]